MTLVLHCGFSGKLFSKAINFKTFRLTQSPLQAKKQIYFLNQTNEEKYLAFFSLFLFFLPSFYLCPFFMLHTSFLQYVQVQDTSHIYFCFKDLVIFTLKIEPFLLFSIHLSQLAIFEKLIPLSFLSPFLTFSGFFVIFPTI